MKVTRLASSAFLVALFSGAFQAQATDTKDKLLQQPPKEQSLVFVANKNQWEAPVLYKAGLPGGNVFLSKQGFTYSYYNIKDLERIHDMGHDKPGASVANEMVNCYAYRVNFAGANTNPVIDGGDKKASYHNYIVGNDASKWAGNVPVYGKVVYHNIYTGVDAAVYSKGTSMKYDFIVAPGAKAGDIALQFEGITPVLQPDGSLMIKTTVNQVAEDAPYAYQIVEGKEQAVKCNYTLDKKTGTVHFEFPQGYNKNIELIIDPSLVFGTYSGGTGNTFGFSATYDDDGNLYAGGECFTVGWPVSTGAYQVNFAGSVDAGINKYSATGTTLIYSTYYGGNGSDLPNNMIVNSMGQLVICGSTSSSNLPTTAGCYASTFAGGSNDIYVAHFNAAGSGLIGATYIGGSGTDGSNTFTLSNNYGDQNRGEVFTDTLGNIYVASSTSSTNFPTTTNAAQTTLGGAQDGCVLKLNPTCSSLLYSSYLGGSGDDACFALVLSSTGNIVTIGGTSSTNFPTTTGALHTASQGGTDGFASIISPAGALLQSTYLGTTAYDHAFKVQIDPEDNVYVMGQTLGDYPVSTGVYSLAGHDIFIDKLSPTLNASLLSTRIGNTQGGSKFVPTAFLLDECGNIYLCGFYPNAALPVSPNAFATAGGFWLAVLEPAFANLMYATFIGGGNHVDGGTSRFDPKGIVYHSVCTADLNFPTQPTVWSPTKLAGGFDVASFKFNFEATGVHAEYSLAANSSDSGCAPHTVSFVNESIVANNYTWDFGDNTPTVTTTSPTHTFTAPGVYTVTLHANNPTSCITDDSFQTQIWVFETVVPQLAVKDTVICLFQPTDITVNVLNPASVVSYAWTPAAAVVTPEVIRVEEQKHPASRLIANVQLLLRG